MVEFSLRMLNVAISAAKEKAEQKSANKAATSQTEYENSRIRRAQEIEERKKKEQLKSKQASRRASFGARGISSTGGSAEAVLSGLTKTIDDELAINAQNSDHKIDMNNATLKDLKSKNLLALSAPFERIIYGKLKSKLPSRNLLD